MENPKELVNQVDNKGHNFFLFAYKKTEKVITAIYLITNLIPFEEPLRWQLRHGALSLLGELLPLKDMKRGDYVELRIVPVISELLSLVMIGESAGIISPMNAELLRGELSRLGLVLKEKYGVHEKHDYLASDFFTVLETEDYHTDLLKDVNIPESNGHSVAEGSLSMQTHKGQEILKDNRINSKRQQAIRKEKAPKTSSNEELARIRRERILGLLKRENSLSVRDISTVVPGYSEKTIHRDLTGLVKDGLVKQKGKRRWTRYSRVA